MGTGLESGYRFPEPDLSFLYKSEFFILSLKMYFPEKFFNLICNFFCSPPFLSGIQAEANR